MTTSASRLQEIAGAFLKLGCLSFGGPVAHLGYFRSELVERRKWLEEAQYADLVALCQFLPGPASSQVAFALGMKRAGFFGALVASACFTLPSASLMIAFAYGVSAAGDVAHAGWLHGLKVAAVAVVAQAVWGMGRSLCTDRGRITIALLSAAALLAVPGKFAQIGVLGGGALVGLWLYRRTAWPVSTHAPEDDARRPVLAVGALLLFGALLLSSVLVPATGNRPAALFASFYRSGSLVFGGGHVVLPLLRAELVPTGWLSDDQFLAGYAGAQALPGPMFTISAYLGTAMTPGPMGWVTGAWCLFAIFLPAWLLVGGTLPLWHRLQAKGWVRAALAGANASVVGVLLAALYDPVMSESIRDGTDVAAAVLAFGLLEQWKVPSWTIVLALAIAGQWVLPH